MTHHVHIGIDPSAMCECYQIGGPWIAEDPDCPIHGLEAQARKRDQEDRERDFENRIADLERRVAGLEAR